MATGEYTKAIAEGPRHGVNLMASHFESVYAGELLKDIPRPSIDVPTLPFEEEFPMTLEHICEAIRTLPTKKAPVAFTPVQVYYKDPFYHHTSMRCTSMNFLNYSLRRR
ncbi:hypothetical protein EC973_003999 [Apophysomyces ossiformis]|uniref:Uncharacterized protein n=1 Tax=Apophysomyces ossiformis TaxID=679940 RepID=A0A8H7BT09_9FUNG|nr:hypothetical protein EC973_003999 [Apophysomyces ossiformis]